MHFAMKRRSVRGVLATGVAGVLLAGVVAAVAAASARPAARDAFVGTWRGTSLCANRTLAPACNDEAVVYRVTSASADTAHLAAFRIVRGEEQPMGEMRFDRRKNAGASWDAEFKTPRFHGRWSFQAADTILTGVLIDVPRGAILRKVRAVRVR